jgi:hypothetical protein
MTYLLADLRYGLRVLVRSRSHTAASVLALAIGIGANSVQADPAAVLRHE